MDYIISADRSWIDVDVVWRFLAEESYWARGVPRKIVEKSLSHSIPFGVYLVGSPSVRKQVGFARVVSDRATFAYLADVFILKGHRGQGLSKRLMEAVLAHPELQALRRWLLFTADAHSLYERFGFVATAYPDRIMEIRRPYVAER
ncbi:MAG TPA: GNAT family N-acetyltransferase [Chthoniobacterales bacterium]|nr:GNAT family N-acetyltransferase [Chthoniobacterales bacterium]